MVRGWSNVATQHCPGIAIRLRVQAKIKPTCVNYLRNYNVPLRAQRARRCDSDTRRRLSHAYFFVFVGRCQSSIVTCFARATVSFAAGTSFTTVEPAAMVAAAPTVIGATSTLLDPVCTSFSIVVRFLLAPS